MRISRPPSYLVFAPSLTKGRMDPNRILWVLPTLAGLLLACGGIILTQQSTSLRHLVAPTAASSSTRDPMIFWWPELEWS